MSNLLKDKKILFGLSGSIAAFKAATAISSLVKMGCEVQTAATPSALKFLGEATLEGLTGRPVFKDIFESSKMMDHIHLARWADVFVICPASANTLNRLVAGLGDDVLGVLNLSLGNEKPRLIFPAMNHEMLGHPITQESIKKLTALNYKIAPTGKGDLACGEVGEGRLLEAEEIISFITQVLKGNTQAPQKTEVQKVAEISTRASQERIRKEIPSGTHPLLRKKILITSGPTREMIDDVRFISNVSTGETGARLAMDFQAQGHEVVFLAGPGSQRPESTSATAVEKEEPVENREKGTLAIKGFSSAEELASVLKKELAHQKFDWIFHLAAVADYRVKDPILGKMDSSEQKLTLELEANPKILNLVRQWAKPDTKIVGFKFTSTEDEQKALAQVKKLFTQSDCDFVVQNDQKDWKQLGLSRNFKIHSKSGETLVVKGVQRLGPVFRDLVL